MAAMLMSGCKEQGEVTEVVPKPVPEPEPAYVIADIALAVPDVSGDDTGVSTTRMSSEIVQEHSSRLVQLLSLTPFTKKGKIESSDLSTLYYDATDLGNREYGAKTINGNAAKFLYFENFALIPGVASFLTYGKAKPVESGLSDDIAKKSYNGSLIIRSDGVSSYQFPDLINPGKLSFELEPIYDIDSKPATEKIPVEAQQLADYLTSIGNTKIEYTDKGVQQTLRWSETDGMLLGLFNNFINLGNDYKPGLIAGSSANVMAFVNALYHDIDQLQPNLLAPRSTLCAEIKNTILAGAGLSDFTQDGTKVTSLGVVYPGNLGLPDGAAVYQWDSENKQFAVMTQTSSTSNITGIGRYAYPPELFYYGNSQIRTSNTAVSIRQYSSGKTTWEDMLSLYVDNDEVTRSTKSLAIKDALQYGVARFQATVNPVPSVLKDSKGNNVTVTPTSFPITGIIISGQHPVGFDFKIPENSASSEDPTGTGIELFVYDHHIQSEDGQIFLSSTTETPAFSTLVLQSQDYKADAPDQSDVTVILEFENNSGQDFYGENKMVVFQGTKFYLIGKLKLNSAENAGSVDDDTKKRIFTQDHTTEVSMTINTLAQAYNVMPNILSGRMELSVEMKLKWVEATPTTVILK